MLAMEREELSDKIIREMEKQDLEEKIRLMVKDVIQGMKNKKDFVKSFPLEFNFKENIPSAYFVEINVDKNRFDSIKVTAPSLKEIPAKVTKEVLNYLSSAIWSKYVEMMIGNR